ncbi:MAG TPA: acyl-CoA dehydrogenase family protein [Candidatus Eisenbacteria bacterium]|nr:acyl-CoA dehydrogenase family protein [Candidatus Eisenbacteria bacterium]
MDFNLSAAEVAFRDALRAWLERHCPRDWERTRQALGREARAQALIDWQRRLHAAGYVGLHWPVAYGGRGGSVMEQVIFYEEMARARAPELANAIGLDMAGPALMVHGTEEQKRLHLPRILSADHIFCQGFSEPGAGSDLAALGTRAERRGSAYVITGQKVWTSFAHYASWCTVLARTDPAAPRHRGLTYFLVDMASPGFTVRPLRQMSGDSEFSEIFLDGVEVPEGNVLGREHGGWEVAITTLMFERGPRTLTRQLILRQGLTELLELARRPTRAGPPPARDPLVRQRLAQLYIDAETLRCANLRVLTQLVKGEPAGPAGSASKLFFSETWQKVAELGLELQGAYAALGEGSEWTVDDGRWQYRALRSRGNTIQGGTSEVMRNILAERVLGLPKD